MTDHIVAEKFCSRCKQIKPTSGFYKNASKKSGLSVACKSCTKTYNYTEVEQVCVACGKRFRVKKNVADSTPAIYCEMACYNRNRPMRTLAERFWEKVERTTTCWLWHGARVPRGYGLITVKRVNLRTHRVAYELTHGPIPEGLLVCHTCDNPPCVNPAHLFLGTHKDNSDDCVQKGRHARGDRSGARLHPERRSRGENRPCAKLNESTVREIRQLAGKMRQRDIATQYGVTQGVVWNVIHRKTWKHVN